MVKISLLFVFFLICEACFAQQKLVGHYIISPKTNLQKVFSPLSGFKSYIVGSEITLNRDSSFEYSTCGNIIKGTWSSDADSVYFSIITNEYRTDSLRKYGGKANIPKDPLAFKIGSHKSNKVILYRLFDNTLEILRIEEPD
ncbi:MAG: hypothetical protein IPP79_19185 [Chitinophagaceae bacterium]|nr:hypothetical protein [Chitinophagaceae bacterium]